MEREHADIVLHVTITSEAPTRVNTALWLVHGAYPMLSCRSLGLAAVNPRQAARISCDLSNVSVTGDRFGPVWLVLETTNKPSSEALRIWRLVVTRGTRMKVVRLQVEDGRDRLAQVRRSLNNVPKVG